jgi:hypothetical protein
MTGSLYRPVPSLAGCSSICGLRHDRKSLRPLDSFGRPGVAPGEFYVIHHMTSDSKGNLYASEVQDGRRIQKFVFKGLARQ